MEKIKHDMHIDSIDGFMTSFSLETLMTSFEEEKKNHHKKNNLKKILDLRLYCDVLFRATPVLLIYVQASVLQLYSYFLLKSYNSLYLTAAFGLFNSFRMLTFELIHGCIDENTDILFSRAFSSQDREKSKEVIYCALISLAIMILAVITPLILSAEYILVFIGFDKHTSNLTYEMLLFALPSMALQCLDKLFISLGYSQNIATPYIFSQVAVTAINMVLLYIEVDILKLGLRGIVQAKLLSDIFPLVFNILILLRYGDRTYFGFPKKVSNLKSKLIRFMKDTLDFAIAEYCETVGLKIPIILVSWTHNIKLLTAYVSADNLGNFSIMTSISLGTSYNIKLNRLLGLGNFEEAKIEFFRTCCFTFSLGCIILCCVISFKQSLVRLYSSEKEVQDELDSLVLIIGVMLPMDLIFETVTSTIRSLGLSKLLSLCSIVLLIVVNMAGGYYIGISKGLGKSSFLAVYGTLMYLETGILFGVLATKSWDECELDISLEEENEDEKCKDCSLETKDEQESNDS